MSGISRFTLVVCSLFVVLISCSASHAADLWTSPSAGGTGGTGFHSLCPNQQVMVGVKGRHAQWMDQIQAICSPITCYGAWRGSLTYGAAAGGSGGNAFTIQCPRNQAVSAIKGKAGQYVDNIQIACRAIGRDGTGKLTGSHNWQSYVAGGTGGTAFGPWYPDGDKPFYAFMGRGGNYIDNIAAHAWYPRPYTISGTVKDNNGNKISATISATITTPYIAKEITSDPSTGQYTHAVCDSSWQVNAAKSQYVCTPSEGYLVRIEGQNKSGIDFTCTHN